MDADITDPGTAAPGLRERKRLETLHAIADAALRLFERSGVHGTTADDIAEAAGVSARTFYRYATTKENALFVDDPSFEDVMHRSLAGAGQGMSVLEAVEEGWMSLITRLDDATPDEQALALRYRRLIIAEPTLSAIALAREADQVDRLASAIQRTQLDGDELAARALATVTGSAVRLAIDEWARRTEAGESVRAGELYAQIRRSLQRQFTDAADA